MLYRLLLTSEGGASAWLSQDPPPQTSPHPRPDPMFHTERFEVCAAVTMRHHGGRVYLAVCCCVSLHHRDGASQEHLGNLLLSPQMKGRTPRGAGRPGRLTSHICPTGAASQVRITAALTRRPSLFRCPILFLLRRSSPAQRPRRAVDVNDQIDRMNLSTTTSIPWWRYSHRPTPLTPITPSHCIIMHRSSQIASR